MKKQILQYSFFVSFTFFSLYASGQAAADEDTSTDLNCPSSGEFQNDSTRNVDIANSVNVGTADDRSCYSDYSESSVNGKTWGVYNITDGSNHWDGSSLQPRIERALPIASNTNIGTYVKFSGTFRILEVGEASGTSNDGTYIAQAKGQHTGGGGSSDPAICLYLAKPVFDSNENQIAFDIYAERISERGGSGSTGREIVLLKRVNKNEVTNFELEVGFRQDPNDSNKKIHYCDATIGGDDFNFNIPEPDRATQSKIRYGAYRVKGGRAQVRWANTTHILSENGVDENLGNEEPMITLLGDSIITVDQATNYSDSGAIAIDNYDGDLTGNIVTTNPVDVNVPGTYTITYNVTDANENVATQVTRTVIVTSSATYSQTSLPGTIQVETGDLSQNNNHYDRNIVGSGNGGTNNIVDNWRKTQNRPTVGDSDSGSGVNGTIINNVIVTADGNYDFTFTYYKNSSNNTISINSTDATGGNSTTLASFTMIRNDASGTGTATASSYSTQTVTGVALTTGINYITFTNAASATLDLDNVIVAASAAPTPPTMTSTKDGDWNDSSVWSVSGEVANTPSTTPTSEYDIVISHNLQIPTGMGAAEAKSITIDAGKDLDLRQNNTLTVTNDITLGKSDNGMIIYNQNGSFPTVIFGGNYTSGKKTTIVKRLEDDKWTLVSAGLSNSKQFKTFDDSRNETVEATSPDRLAFGDYNDANASGLKYTYISNPDADSNGKFDDDSSIWGSGKGWATKSNDTGGSDVVFMGDLHAGDVTIGISTGGNGYNLVGNPYPTYLYGNLIADNTNNVLTVNSSLIDGTIWLWDSTNSAWITKNQSDGAYHINPLQGFFVKATSDGNLSFTEAMQTHTSNSDNFLKTTNSRFEIDLSIASGKLNRKTSIRYIDGKTTSFDNGFDSNIFSGYSSELEVYTGLVSGGSGEKLAIQSLPNENYEDMVIPVGVTAETDSQIKFTTEALNVPSSYKVFLEDRLNSIFIRLDEVGAEYTTAVSETSTDGRFYLHAKSSALVTDTELLNSISIYKSNASTLRIVGLSEGRASVKLFNILGKQVMTSNFNKTGVKELSLPNLSKGVYIVQLETENGKLNKKIVL